MSFENNNSNEQIKIDPSNQQEQIDRDFDAIVKEYQKMNTEEQAKFIEGISSKNPHFKELYNQLKTYFWGQIEAIDDNVEELNIIELFEIEVNKTSELMEDEKGFFDTNKDFSNYKEFISEKEINGNNIVSLNKEIYAGYLRYEENKEPLIKALGYKEIDIAKQELIWEKEGIQSNPLTADIHKRRDLLLKAEDTFDKKVNKVIENYLDSADNLNNLLKTDAGKLLLENTGVSIFQDNLKSSIKTNLGYTENKETDLSAYIELKTTEVIINISKLQTELNQKIEDFKINQTDLKKRDYIAWEKILYQDIPNEYSDKIDEVIKDYAKTIGKELIDNESDVVSKGKTFNLPLGGGKDVILDFSEIEDIDTLSKEQLLKEFETESTFDDVYINSLSEKIVSELLSTKGLIDISGIVVAGFSAFTLSEGTGGFALPIAGLTFTAVENAYRAGMYEAFVDGGYKEGLGINENDTHNDIIKEKLFELTSNTLLFSLFKLSGMTEDFIINNYLKNKTFVNNLENQIKRYSIKTGAEATFFTYYTVVSNNIANNIKTEGNTNEYLKSFTDVGSVEDLSKLYMYNLGFITLVKVGGKTLELAKNHKDIKVGEVLSMYKELNVELQKLKDKGYVLVRNEFYKGNEKVTNIKLEDFKKFIEVNEKVGFLATNGFRKSESGKAGKSMNTNNLSKEKKYEKLEKYSKEVQNGKIDYALNDKVIGKTLTDFGLQNGKGIGEGLLKKSGFDKSEIKNFKEGKLKGEKPIERTAIKEMEKASKMIYKEVTQIKTLMLKGELNSEKLSQYELTTVQKLYSLIKNGKL